MLGGTYKQCVRELIADSGDVVLHHHGIWVWEAHAVATLARVTGVPLIISPHGMLKRWALEHHRLRKMVAWRMYQNSDLKCATAFLATAESEYDALREAGITAPIAVLPIGVEMPACEPKISREVRTALILSRMHPVKGILELISAWAQVRPNGWRLQIAGNDEGGYLDEVLKAIEMYNLHDTVVYLGPVFGEGKARLYRDADLFILPSFSENFGIVVAEALSYGVPVLTTMGTPWNVLETQKCGWWVPLGNGGLSEGLMKATCTAREELLAMGERGRLLVQENYQWSSIGTRMIEFYRWVRGHGRCPDFVR
jgi:glycosyltransferase involved in cell wall biosynthesis